MMNERPPTSTQQALPFDDEADRPVPFALTARARREVAPDALPDLAVVGRGEDDGALDQPADTRPARARALRRAGSPVAQIAHQLEVEELTVRAWLGDLAGRPRPVADRRAAVVSLPGTGVHRVHDRRAALRARAREEARARLAEDPTFAAGLGLLVGAGEIDDHGVGLATADPRVAAAAVTWLTGQARVDRARIRIVLRLGRGLAGDRARHEWAGRLGLPLEQVTHTRWRGSPEPDAVEALVHVTDEDLAARLAGWSEALLEPAPEPLDAAF